MNKKITTFLSACLIGCLSILPVYADNDKILSSDEQGINIEVSASQKKNQIIHLEFLITNMSNKTIPNVNFISDFSGGKAINAMIETPIEGAHSVISDDSLKTLTTIKNLDADTQYKYSFDVEEMKLNDRKFNVKYTVNTKDVNEYEKDNGAIIDKLSVDELLEKEKGQSIGNIIGTIDGNKLFSREDKFDEDLTESFEKQELPETTEGIGEYDKEAEIDYAKDAKIAIEETEENLKTENSTNSNMLYIGGGIVLLSVLLGVFAVKRSKK